MCSFVTVLIMVRRDELEDNHGRELIRVQDRELSAI